MWNACKPILVGMPSLVSQILLLSSLAKFLFYMYFPLILVMIWHHLVQVHVQPVLNYTHTHTHTHTHTLLHYSMCLFVCLCSFLVSDSCNICCPHWWILLQVRHTAEWISEQVQSLACDTACCTVNVMLYTESNTLLLLYMLMLSLVTASIHI